MECEKGRGAENESHREICLLLIKREHSYLFVQIDAKMPTA